MKNEKQSVVWEAGDVFLTALSVGGTAQQKSELPQSLFSKTEFCYGLRPPKLLNVSWCYL